MTTNDAPKKNYWVSWYGTSIPFTLHWPWWISGYAAGLEDDDIPTICAAVRAPDEQAAREIIFACHDQRPYRIEFRFVNEREDDWSPYGSDRFPKADWMPDWPTDDPTEGKSEIAA